MLATRNYSVRHSSKFTHVANFHTLSTSKRALSYFDNAERSCNLIGGRHFSSNSSNMDGTISKVVNELQKEVVQIKSKLQVLEESRAANALVALYASRRLRTFDMKYNLKIFTADTIHSPIYCHNQLPTILGHYITGLDNLPVGLNAMPSILAVRETLLQSFKKLLACEIPVTSGASNTKVGLVDLEINLEKVVRNAIDDAKQICTDHYGDCPDTEVVMAKPASSFRFPYMSTTIQYVVVELMKNAFRATVEAHMKRNEAGIVTCEDMPPVRILIYLDADTQHACICISDEGMGMTQEALHMAMAYSYTTVREPSLKLRKKSEELSQEEMSTPLAGYGYGIPMSRVYAQSFGGDLQLQTMEGYGTRAYYYIKAN